MSEMMKDVVPKWFSCTHRQITKLWFLLLTVTIIFIQINTFPTFASPTAQTYYVAPNGNNNNPGTLNKPWRTISYAADNSIVRPGDLIYVRDGVYNEYILQTISGKPGLPITYRNYPGETPIINSNQTSGNWRWQILDQSHLVIDGFHFKDYHGGAIQIRSVKNDLSDIVIIDNHFENQMPNSNGGNKTIHVTTYNSGHNISDVTIQDNLIHNVDNGVPPNANETITLSGNVSQTKIVNNEINWTTNIGIDVIGRPDHGQPHNILIKGNRVSEYGQDSESAAGIYLDGAGKNIVIEDNIVHDGVNGIYVNLEPSAANLKTTNVIVRRNTIFNNKQINLMLGVGGYTTNCNNSGTLDNSVAVHNTIYSSISNVANNYFNCGQNLSWKNNIYAHVSSNDNFQYKYGNETVNSNSWEIASNYFVNRGGLKSYRWKSYRYDFLSDYQRASGQDLHSNEGNLLFADETKFDFSLLSNSIARDMGGYLTVTSQSGSGTKVPVVDAKYFSDGLGLQAGDSIKIAAHAPVTVMSVDYTKNEITVDRSISWNNQDPVSYDYSGSRPEPGAYELESFLTFQGIPDDQKITLKWDSSYLPESTQFFIHHDGPIGDQEIPIINISGNTTSYTLTGLTNYVFYNVTLGVKVDGELLFTESVNIMPTDQFFYLPLVFTD